MNTCSKATRAYLLNLKDKPKLSHRIQELKLSTDEEARFEKFKDNIVMMEYMDMPVSLHENCYDITTLIGLLREPLSNEEFLPIEISSCRKLLVEFEEMVKQLQLERENAGGFVIGIK